MNRHPIQRRDALLGTICAMLIPNVVVSQTTALDPCRSPALAGLRQEMLQTWQNVLDHAFDDLGFGIYGLVVGIIENPATPRSLGNCPKGLKLNQIRRNPDGQTSGNIIGAPRERRIFFDMNMLEDWSFQSHGDSKQYGNFGARAAHQSDVQLHPDPLPPDWR